MSNATQPPQWGLVPIDAEHVLVVAADPVFLAGLPDHFRGDGFECQVVPGPLPITFSGLQYDAASAVRVRGWSRRVDESILRYQRA